MAKKRNNSLGRGLDALISTDYLSIDTSGSSSINEIPLEAIVPNQEQPRSNFDREPLEELAESIRHLGIIQPITVFMTSDSLEAQYKIISGERRYRAAKMAGLSTIPAYIRTAEDETVMEMALVENIQREDLNAIEIALAFKKLMEQYNLTQEELSKRVGKKRATISNYLRLLKLPAEVQMGLKDGKVSMGHARALLSVEDTELLLALYEQIMEEGLSVRAVEQIAHECNESCNTLPLRTKTLKKESPSRSTDNEFSLLANRFSAIFNTKVRLARARNGKGKITIPFESDEQLADILMLLDKIQ